MPWRCQCVRAPGAKKTLLTVMPSSARTTSPQTSPVNVSVRLLGGLALAAADDLHVASLVWSWTRTPPAMSPSASTTRLEIWSP